MPQPNTDHISAVLFENNKRIGHYTRIAIDPAVVLHLIDVGQVGAHDELVRIVEYFLHRWWHFHGWHRLLLAASASNQANG